MINDNILILGSSNPLICGVFFRRKLEGHIQTLYNYFRMNGQVERFYKILTGNDKNIRMFSRI